jgi:hypothetical protein
LSGQNVDTEKQMVTRRLLDGICDEWSVVVWLSSYRLAPVQNKNVRSYVSKI